MKTLNKTIALALIAVFALTASSFASGSTDKNKKSESTSTSFVHGAQDDWELLAYSANYLIENDRELLTAKEWIEKSVSLKEESYNLEIMGDYLHKINQHEEAIVYYIKSIEKLKEAKGVNVNTTSIQKKIIEAKADM